MTEAKAPLEVMMEKVAVLTGAGRGIGLEVCRQLAERGMTVVLTARDPEKAKAAAEQSVGEGLDVIPKALDVSNDESVRGLAAELEQEFGTWDVLVNNAAAYADWSEMASSADLELAQGVLETNLFGAWRACKMFLPLIRRSGHGRIFNVSSGAGSHGDPQFGLTTDCGSAASYGISKAAINALTEKLAAELSLGLPVQGTRKLRSVPVVTEAPRRAISSSSPPNAHRGDRVPPRGQAQRW
jgi:NAD(P)-dependent dehydrogenase (short-subunit alcohol dehydrogenase family)